MPTSAQIKEKRYTASNFNSCTKGIPQFNTVDNAINGRYQQIEKFVKSVDALLNKIQNDVNIKLDLKAKEFEDKLRKIHYEIFEKS